MSHRPAKRSVTLAGHRTSVSLEDAFWDALRDIARSQSKTINAMISEIDATRNPDQGLASALRLFVLNWYRAKPRDHNA